MTDARNRQPAGVPTGGEFAANAHDGAPSGLPAEPEYTSPPVQTTLVLEHFDDDYSDETVVIGEREIDLGKVLDGYDLDALPEEPQDDGDLDQFFYDAEKLGLFEGHGGAFSVRVDQGQYQSYIQARREAGKDEAIAKIPHLSPEQYGKIIDSGFDKAFPKNGFAGVANWSDAVDARAWARGARDAIKLEIDGVIEPDEIKTEDAEVIRHINALADASDETVQRSVAKQNAYFKNAQRVAFSLGDRMIERARAERAPF